MADRYFNRDRNRPYDEDFDDENYGQGISSRGRSERGYGYGGDYNRGYGMRGRNYGYDRYNQYADYRGYDRFGDYNRGMSGYGTNRDYDYDYDFDSGPWSRTYYDRGQGGYGYGGYGRGQANYGGTNQGNNRRYGGAGYGGYGGNYGRYSGWGQSGYRDMGYDSDYEDDYDFDFVDYEEPGVWTYEEVWIIPGPFTGIGPEGYQRPDERIREDINERLTRHGRLNARNVHVEVNNCEVTLKGTVDNRQAKRMAEEVAESVSGVKDVHNQLRVQDQQSRDQQGQIAGQTQGQRSQQAQQGKTEREGQTQRQR